MKKNFLKTFLKFNFDFKTTCLSVCYFCYKAGYYFLLAILISF